MVLYLCIEGRAVYLPFPDIRITIIVFVTLNTLHKFDGVGVHDLDLVTVLELRQNMLFKKANDPVAYLHDGNALHLVRRGYNVRVITESETKHKTSAFGLVHVYCHRVDFRGTNADPGHIPLINRGKEYSVTKKAQPWNNDILRKSRHIILKELALFIAGIHQKDVSVVHQWNLDIL